VTDVAPDGVGALAAVANPGVLFALVDVRASFAVQQERVA
jgi:hypothetical protein